MLAEGHAVPPVKNDQVDEEKRTADRPDQGGAGLGHIIDIDAQVSRLDAKPTCVRNHQEGHGGEQAGNDCLEDDCANGHAVAVQSRNSHGQSLVDATYQEQAAKGDGGIHHCYHDEKKHDAHPCNSTCGVAEYHVDGTHNSKSPDAGGRRSLGH